MSAKKAAPGVTKATTVVANDPDDLKGALKFIGGSRSDSWNNIPANQAVETLWLKNSDKAARDRQYGATVAALAGIRPRDELEGMLAGQLLAAHNAAMECYRRAMIGEQTFEGRREKPEPGKQALPYLNARRADGLARGRAHAWTDGKCSDQNERRPESAVARRLHVERHVGRRQGLEAAP